MIKENLLKVQDRIKKACENCDRDPREILLVAVSKTKPNKDILEALSNGQIHFGENRARELEEKMQQISEVDIKWHFIGNLQTNKIKYMVDRVDWIQSVHKKKALKEIEKRASRIDRNINALIQVNISGEDQKGGCEPQDLEKVLMYAQKLKFTHVRGLMGMATYTDEPEKVRYQFQSLCNLRDRYRSLEKNFLELKHLSMGMSNDLEVAIEEGATMIRVGTDIFGERNY